jgi:hypothetical protein
MQFRSRYRLFAVADRCGAVGFRRYDELDPAVPQVVSDRVGVVGFVGEQSVGVCAFPAPAQSATKPLEYATRPRSDGRGSRICSLESIRDSCVNRFCPRGLEQPERY